MKLKKTVGFFSYYLIPVVAFLILLYQEFVLENSYELLVNYGSFAMNIVLIILFVKPLSVLFGKHIQNLAQYIKELKENFKLKQLLLFPLHLLGFISRKIMPYRKELGVLSFWFALFHGVALMFYLNVISFYTLERITDPTDYVLSGMIALFGMIILGLTSNTFSQIKLKQNWKKLHYLAYPTFVVIVIHKSQTELELGPLMLLVIYFSLKYFEYKSLHHKTKTI